MLSLLQTQIKLDESRCSGAVSLENHTIFSGPLNSIYGFLNVFGDTSPRRERRGFEASEAKTVRKLALSP